MTYNFELFVFFLIMEPISVLQRNCSVPSQLRAKIH